MPNSCGDPAIIAEKDFALAPKFRESLLPLQRRSPRMWMGSIDRTSYLSALEELPVIERATFILASTDGLSYREIGFRLGMDSSSVETHFAAALSSMCIRLVDK
ncbi:sigma factor-like helix-turn-helix DNA-binding protein [Sphingomonas abietis]|uniref:sigma-70 region 4 domain-containing protein n=1 Tax=Sphingomonas abietis TaxID=3012344 RepID=UPI00389A3633